MTWNTYQTFHSKANLKDKQLLSSDMSYKVNPSDSYNFEHGYVLYKFSALDSPHDVFW